MTTGRRSAVAILLHATEREPVAAELLQAGLDPVPVTGARDLAVLLAERSDIVAAILDLDFDHDEAAAAWSLLHAGRKDIPALLVVNPASFDGLDLTGPGHEEDEYVTRPFSAESIRWRIEAMHGRFEAVHGDARPVAGGRAEGSWARRGELVAIFSPKGGVGKTMIATNLAAMLVARGRRVLLVDADTTTGHLPISLGMDGAPTVADAWIDELQGGTPRPFAEIASDHPSGLRVLPLSAGPVHSDLLQPERVAEGIAGARRTADFVIADMHPEYSPLNRAVFDHADRILVPLTPDLPAIRAVIWLREVAEELGVRDRLAIIVNRAGTGVAVADIERAVGMSCYAQIRSAGLVIVKATNEGRTLLEVAPKQGITQDFSALVDRILGVDTAPKGAFRMFGRQAAVRA